MDNKMSAQEDHSNDDHDDSYEISENIIPLGEDVDFGGSSSSSSSEDDVGGPVELIRRYLAHTLGFLGPSGLQNLNGSQSTPPPMVLKELTVDGIVEYIQSDKCKRIITMAGAGISTAAGIPDFRSPGSGLYDNLQKYELPYPQAIFEMNFFRQNPKPFFVLAKELYPGVFKPTLSHYFIKLLAQKGLLLRHYTQNIDTLERVAGLTDEQVVEAHGSFFTSHCLECNKQYEMDWMKAKIFSDCIPVCEDCSGVVKPDIVFFGENLPMGFFEKVSVDFPQCDLLIIMGSSLVVQPFASLKDRVPLECPRLLLNREMVGQPDIIAKSLGMTGIGLDFDASSATRDVFLQGSTDESCQLLAEKLGWSDDLKELVTTGHKAIDELMVANAKCVNGVNGAGPSTSAECIEI